MSTFYTAVQESFFGQAARLITKDRVFKYPEELPDFVLPWEQAGLGGDDVIPPNNEIAEAEKTIPPTIPESPLEKAETRASNASSSSASTTAGEFRNNSADADVEKVATRGSSTRDAHMSRIATQKTHTGSLGPVTTLTRTRTREQTRQYTRERFDVEEQEAIERKQTTIIMPQKTADGVILVDWYTTDDPANPQNWGSWYKIWVVTIIWFYTFMVYMTSAIYTPAEPYLMELWDIGQSKASLGLSIYVLGYGVGPLIFSPLSEIPVLGRNIPYVITFGLFVILAVPMALADSYASFMVLRFLTGFVGSPCLATGGASMGDIYSLLKLPYGLSAWVAAAFSAPALGPLLSGFSIPAKGWRWVNTSIPHHIPQYTNQLQQAFWEVLWGSAPIFLLMFFLLPETSASNILLRRAKRLRKLTGNQNYRSQSEIDQGSMAFSKIALDAIWKPVEISIKDPAVMFTNIYTSFIYSIYYSYFEVFPLAYIGIYGFNLGELGLVFICIIVGCVVGIVIYGSYVWFYLEPDIKKNGLRASEHRLVPALFASMLLPAGMFWFGWTAEPGIHWIVVSSANAGFVITYADCGVEHNWYNVVCGGSFHPVPMYIHVLTAQLPPGMFLSLNPT